MDLPGNYASLLHSLDALYVTTRSWHRLLIFKTPETPGGAASASFRVHQQDFVRAASDANFRVRDLCSHCLTLLTATTVAADVLQGDCVNRWSGVTLPSPILAYAKFCHFTNNALVQTLARSETVYENMIDYDIREAAYASEALYKLAYEANLRKGVSSDG